MNAKTKTTPMNHHYFISGFDVWVCDEDLNLGLKRFWKDSRADRCSIYRVPLPDEGSQYTITDGTPDVEGTTWVDSCYRKRTDRTPSENHRLNRAHAYIAELNKEPQT